MQKALCGLCSMVAPFLLVVLAFGAAYMVAPVVKAAATDVAVDTSPRASPEEPVEQSEEPVGTGDSVGTGSPVVSVVPVRESVPEEEQEEQEAQEEPQEAQEEPQEAQEVQGAPEQSAPIEQEEQEEPVEPVTLQTVNDAAVVIAGCIMFCCMFLAGLIFSRYVPGGFVRG